MFKSWAVKLVSLNFEGRVIPDGSSRCRNRPAANHLTCCSRQPSRRGERGARTGGQSSRSRTGPTLRRQASWSPPTPSLAKTMPLGEVEIPYDRSSACATEQLKPGRLIGALPLALGVPRLLLASGPTRCSIGMAPTFQQSCRQSESPAGRQVPPGSRSRRHAQENGDAGRVDSPPVKRPDAWRIPRHVAGCRSVSARVHVMPQADRRNRSAHVPLGPRFLLNSQDRASNMGQSGELAQATPVEGYGSA